MSLKLMMCFLFLLAVISADGQRPEDSIYSFAELPPAFPGGEIETRFYNFYLGAETEKLSLKYNYENNDIVAEGKEMLKQRDKLFGIVTGLAYCILIPHYVHVFPRLVCIGPQ
ncbi:hypothetical protein [Chitinophaga polysaccharea]|uniref:hypothetical protein n=1 Tax=Chitinophaga polysaccharea TaxID=1293035 RepID=UPI001157A27E|nr:hypothetical protein [Chitinophaga polysaccharea]